MRSYTILLSPFWTGPTGKRITAAGKDARIVSTYVLSCDHSNMIGLYRLPLLYVMEETGLKRREILSAIEKLRSLEFSQYDEDTEFVWVREMARIQNGLLPGETLKEEDKRSKGIVALYKHLPSNPFLGPFFDRYADALRLPLRRDFHSERKDIQSPLHGASKPLGRGPISDSVSVLDPNRNGQKGQRDGAGGVELTPEEIQTRWNAIPDVKPCKKLGDTIRARIQTRLQEHPDPNWWDALFQQVQASDFLCGRFNGSKPPFHVTLDWILKPTNLEKFEMGNYDAIRSHAPAICTNRIYNGRFLKDCGKPVQNVKPGQLALCSDCATEVAQRQSHVAVQKGAST
jgi:hypothetical protein